MIPDKIFLIRDAANPEGIFDTVASRKPMFQDDIPYIRKDALLEWVKREREFIEGLFTEGDASFYDGQDDAYNNLITKLQSL